ncbi:hypothetical protein HDV00_007718 [Rhizophlyctis rosea]|nr:hypothetical protein HDV00_007718 [Rhizophlyctis rosea]
MPKVTCSFFYSMAPSRTSSSKDRRSRFFVIEDRVFKVRHRFTHGKSVAFDISDGSQPHNITPVIIDTTTGAASINNVKSVIIKKLRSDGERTEIDYVDLRHHDGPQPGAQNPHARDEYLTGGTSVSFPTTEDSSSSSSAEYIMIQKKKRFTRKAQELFKIGLAVVTLMGLGIFLTMYAVSDGAPPILHHKVPLHQPLGLRDVELAGFKIREPIRLSENVDVNPIVNVEQNTLVNHDISTPENAFNTIEQKEKTVAVTADPDARSLRYLKHNVSWSTKALPAIQTQLIRAENVLMDLISECQNAHRQSPPTITKWHLDRVNDAQNELYRRVGSFEADLAKLEADWLHVSHDYQQDSETLGTFQSLYRRGRDFKASLDVRLQKLDMEISDLRSRATKLNIQVPSVDKDAMKIAATKEVSTSQKAVRELLAAPDMKKVMEAGTMRNTVYEKLVPRYSVSQNALTDEWVVTVQEGSIPLPGLTEDIYLDAQRLQGALDGTGQVIGTENAERIFEDVKHIRVGITSFVFFISDQLDANRPFLISWLESGEHKNDLRSKGEIEIMLPEGWTAVPVGSVAHIMMISTEVIRTNGATQIETKLPAINSHVTSAVHTSIQAAAVGVFASQVVETNQADAAPETFDVIGPITESKIIGSELFGGDGTRNRVAVFTEIKDITSHDPDIFGEILDLKKKIDEGRMVLRPRKPFDLTGPVEVIAEDPRVEALELAPVPCKGDGIPGSVYKGNLFCVDEFLSFLQMLKDWRVNGIPIGNHSLTDKQWQYIRNEAPHPFTFKFANVFGHDSDMVRHWFSNNEDMRRLVDLARSSTGGHTAFRKENFARAMEYEKLPIPENWAERILGYLVTPESDAFQRARTEKLQVATDPSLYQGFFVQRDDKLVPRKAPPENAPESDIPRRTRRNDRDNGDEYRNHQHQVPYTEEIVRDFHPESLAYDEQINQDPLTNNEHDDVRHYQRANTDPVRDTLGPLDIQPELVPQAMWNTEMEYEYAGGADNQVSLSLVFS